MKRYSRIISIVLLFAICFALVGSLSACDNSAEKETLVVYNWADYIDTSIIPEFEEYYKSITGKELEVVYSTFDTNETMLTKVLNGDADVDVVCPSEYAIQRLLVNDALLPIDKSNLYIDGVDTYANINSEFTRAISSVFDGLVTDDEGNPISMNDYLVPYMYGTLGILYNTAYVSEEELEEAGWGLLWNSTNNEDVAQKILMKDSIRDAYAAVVMYMLESGKLPEKYADYSVQQLINANDDDLLEIAEALFIEQKQQLKGYEVDFGKDDMVSETALVDLAWSGDAMYAIEEGEYEDVALDYYVPESGSNIWFDGWCIPKTCQNKYAAELFIAYLNTPTNAMRNMLEIGYSSAVAPEVVMADEEALILLTEYYFDEESEEDMAALAELEAQWEAEGYILANQPDYIQEYVNDYFTWEVRYPTVNDKLGIMLDYGERNETIVSMWERVKATGGWNSVTAWIILGVCVFLLGGFVLALYLKDKYFFGTSRVVSTVNKE